MNEPRKKDHLDLDKLLQEDLQRQREFKHVEMPFADYLAKLEEDPRIAQNSAARILEMILEAGMETIPDSERFNDADTSYKFFSKELFGLEEPIRQVVDHFRAGANRLSTGKQILLLAGPTASGKSSCAKKIKDGLEQYNKRPVFRIKGCPINEEPLRLVPPGPTREALEKKLNVKIKGDLCPTCRANLLANFKEGVDVHWEKVPVETFKFSTQTGIGIGSFEPSDKKTADVSQLIGRENIAVTSTKGYDDPNSYELKGGEIFKGHRGLVELREMIKSPEEMLWIFISVAEEQEVKVQGSSFPHISVDVVLLGHTNLSEYKKFSSREENAALHDRIYVVYFPYPLRIRDEVRIYRKLIESESDFLTLKRCHIAPGALELAATFAVMTRLVEPPNEDIDYLTKAKIYNGDKALTNRSREEDPVDIRELLDQGQENPEIDKREGMFGMSSRDVLAAINNALVRYGEDGCLTPLKVIQALRQVFDHRMGYHPEDIERFKEMLVAAEKDSIMVEYKDFIREAVTTAFLNAYKDLARELYDQYITEAQFARDQKRKFTGGRMMELKKDPLTGRPKEPNLKLLRSIEDQMGISDSEAENYRGELLELKGSLKDQGKELAFGNGTYPPLDEGVKKKLMAESKATLTAVLNTNNAKNQEETLRAKQLFDGLSEGGFCKVCAKEAVEQAREIFES